MAVQLILESLKPILSARRLHDGGAPGMNAILRVYPESGQSVIVLCNLDSPSASRIGDWLSGPRPF